MDDLEKQHVTSFILHGALCLNLMPSVNSNCSYSLETLNLGQNWQFFVPYDFVIWLLCQALVNSSWICSPETLNWGQNQRFLVCVTCKFDGWLWKIVGHLFYTTSSLVHHFKAIGEFKLDLQSRKDQFGSKSVILLSYVTLKFDRWPWKAIGHLFYAASSFVHHFIAIYEFEMELQSWNTQFGSKSAIFCHILKNNRVPLLGYFKLCASALCIIS